jgi:hypothetical protein
MEAGIAGTGPATVTSQTGEAGRIVDWVKSAYEDIQNINASWDFLLSPFTFPTVIGKQDYSASDISISNLSKWKADSDEDFTIYSSYADEAHLPLMAWWLFRQQYLFGSARSATGRPSVVSVHPNKTLWLSPVPDAVFTVTGQYYCKDFLLADTDEPLLPVDYHLAIIWKGLMYYAAYSSASDLYAHGDREYKKIIRKMSMAELPKITFGEPLV